MLDIFNKKCIFIGGGKVAYRKILATLDYGANIVVIDKTPCIELIDLIHNGQISWISRYYETGDLEGAFLAFIAVDNNDVICKISQDASNLAVLLNIANEQSLCDFVVPSKIVRDDLTIAVSTNGKSPFLSKIIRQDLEKLYNPYYGSFLDIMNDVRITAIDNMLSKEEKMDLYQDIMDSKIMKYIEVDDNKMINLILTNIIDKYTKGRNNVS